MPFESYGVLAEQPGAPELKEDGKDPGKGFRVPQPVRGARIPWPDVQAKVRATKRGDGQFIAVRIAGVERSAGAEPGPEAFQGVCLGRFHHGEVKYGAIDDEEQSVGPGDLPRCLCHPRHNIRCRRAGVD